MTVKGCTGSAMKLCVGEGEGKVRIQKGNCVEEVVEEGTPQCFASTFTLALAVTITVVVKTPNSQSSVWGKAKPHVCEKNASLSSTVGG